MRLRDLGTAQLRWDDLLVFIEHSPAGSAVARATNPDDWISAEVQMLREVAHRLDVLAWQKSEGATKNPPRDYPERMPLTAAEVQAYKDAQPPVPDSMPVDDMRDWLGWSASPKEA